MTIAAADLRFPAGSALLAPGFYPTLDALAALAKACPSLHIAVSGPADPGKKAAPSPAAGGDREVATKTATKTSGGGHPDADGSSPRHPSAPAGPGDATATAPDQGCAGQDSYQPRRRRPRNPARSNPSCRIRRRPAKRPRRPRRPRRPKEPPVVLPRQRALALVEYLLQAGARPDQVSAGPDGPSGRVAFALIP